MAHKQILTSDFGLVTIIKRKGARNIRLTINHDGQLRVSIPSWAPFKTGEAFIYTKIEWIKHNLLSKTQILFKDNDRIGKGHRLRFINEDRIGVKTRVGKSEIVIRIPDSSSVYDAIVQEAAKTAAIRALKQEAKLLLPGRLAALANKHGFTYRSVAIKQLKTRWGSCNSQKDIAFNCYLMQLPWELIDYVILHELLHTRVMAHGKPFWDELNQYVPDLVSKRSAIKAHKPAPVASI